MKRELLLALVLASCVPAVAEQHSEIVAVEVPSAPEAPSVSPAERGPKGKGTFLSAIGLTSARIRSARAQAQSVKMAAELHMAVAGDGKCPTLNALVAQKQLEPGGVDDPWKNAFRVVCEDGNAHVISNGRDGVAGSADDVRDDATSADLERIGDL